MVIITREILRKEIELAAIGAAIGSNCAPCLEYHIKEAKNQGLTDSQIMQAVQMAEQVKRVPAGKVSETAFKMLDIKI